VSSSPIPPGDLRALAAASFGRVTSASIVCPPRATSLEHLPVVATEALADGGGELEVSFTLERSHAEPPSVSTNAHTSRPAGTTGSGAARLAGLLFDAE